MNGFRSGASGTGFAGPTNPGPEPLRIKFANL